MEVKKEENVSCSDDSEIENQSPVKRMKGNDYLKMIEEKRQRSLAFLQSLKIDEVKQSLSSSLNALKPKRTFKKQDKRKFVQLPSRKSARLAKQNLSEDSIAKIIENAKAEAEISIKAEVGISKVMERPKKFDFSECMLEEDNRCDFLKDQVTLLSKCCAIKAARYPDDFERMKSNDSSVSKVVPSRITALAIHPTNNIALVTAGSKEGHIGFWNLTLNSSNSFHCHTQGVTDVKYNGYNVHKLMSSSYDGTLLSADLEKLVFEKYYETKDDCCTSFDILSHSTFLVGHTSGEVAIVDSLAKRNVKTHVCHDHRLKGLTIHPGNKNYFATAEVKGLIKVWDLRKLTVKPLCETYQHTRSVSSIYFSPDTGNSLLSTSLDDQCCIFDSSDFSKGLPVKKSIPHNNFTGRWLSAFKASWVPNTSEELFAVGSMKQPRRIEVFNQQGKLVHNFMDENLSTVLSLLAFHPSLPILAGGNSSGRVTVLREL